MGPADIDAFVKRAEEIYAERLTFILEPQHLDEFVAIEPDTGDFFIGRTTSVRLMVLEFVETCNQI
ncbi:MAG: hypothetical protein WCJ09_19490, partial [Planctomycetota bacterium]